MLLIETQDGVAILGYAGLGSTAAGTEPADWINSVIRGRNLPLENCLGEIAVALQRQFPKHLLKLPTKYGAAHSIVAPAFVNGEARLYSIDLVFASDRKAYSFRYTRHVAGLETSCPRRTPRIALAGSGSLFLERDRQWKRQLLKLTRACDAQRVEPKIVADFLASLNSKVCLSMDDNSVGPRSIVVWRHRKESTRKGGGGHQFYNGNTREAASGMLPTVSNGMDIQAIVQSIMPFIMSPISEHKEHGIAKDIDLDGINASLAKLPDKPDETLK
jgi:hypothetical protein